KVAPPQLQARHRRRTKLWTRRQLLSPHTPQRVFADHFFSIAIDSLRAFFVQLLSPARATRWIGKCCNLNCSIPKHIKIVHFTYEILQLLNIASPGRVLFRKKILHRIAKAFDPNAKIMQRNLRSATHGTFVEIVRGRPFFKRKLPENDTSQAYAAGSGRKTPA